MMKQSVQASEEATWVEVVEVSGMESVVVVEVSEMGSVVDLVQVSGMQSVVGLVDPLIGPR